MNKIMINYVTFSNEFTKNMCSRKIFSPETRTSIFLDEKIHK
jgi:hypothetical protein